MNELSVNEKDLLKRIQDKPELRTLFFRKVKGLKWFDSLFDSEYFSAKNIPSPVPAKEKGYVNIPRWDVVDYLVKTSHELSKEQSSDYVPRFLEIITSATAFAKENKFGNYHVWWQFSEVLSQIPSKFLTPENLDVVDYWLDDKYERGIVTQIIGEKWLANLLEEGNDNALSLASKLLEILYSVDFTDQNIGGRNRREANLRFDYYRAEKLTKKIAHLAGCQLKQQAVSVFQSKLEEVLDELDNDAWSSLWQPAIEEHEQNEHHNDAENVLIAGYRDSLTGYMDALPGEASEYVAKLLESPYQTIERLAIYCIGQNSQLSRELCDRLINEKYLQANYRHEIWHFLNRNYANLKDEQKHNALSLIEGKVRKDEKGFIQEVASAYEKSTWLAAVKDFGREELELYREATTVTKTEPDHPDFSSYMSSGWGGQRSPYSVEELRSLSVDELVHTLVTYQGGDGWREPGIEGLSKAVRQLIKSDPLKYYGKLGSLVDLDLPYVHEIIEAYSELWSENANLPWDDVWQYLFSYMMAILEQDRFWDPGNKEQREGFVANRYWVVGTISRLLEAGSKSDDHAFPEKHHDVVESIIKLLLEKESGEQFKEDSDAVSIAINSPRGQCIEALINLTLRACRLEDRENDGNHMAAWAHFRTYYDAELERSEKGEYEFATLVTNYLPNFLFMSKEWVIGNLGRIFDQADYLKWLCAMQGYSYVKMVYPEIYSYLKEHGDFLRVLGDKNLKDHIVDKVVQHIVVAFINDYEELTEEDSLINVLLERRSFEEIDHLIRFFWTLRKDGDNKLRGKVYQLWPMLLDVVDLSSNEGRKLASSLCHWAAFVEHFDASTKVWLLEIAPHADESHNSYDLLENLARLSDKQPFEANEIWLKMLQGSAPDYPEEAIRRILVNLVSQGVEGRRAARDTVSEYLKKGVDRPSVWLREIASPRD